MASVFTKRQTVSAHEHGARYTEVIQALLVLRADRARRGDGRCLLWQLLDVMAAGHRQGHEVGADVAGTQGHLTPNTPRHGRRIALAFFLALDARSWSRVRCPRDVPGKAARSVLGQAGHTATDGAVDIALFVGRDSRLVNAISAEAMQAIQQARIGEIPQAHTADRLLVKRATQRSSSIHPS